jgi:hypothetical protein
MLHLLLVRFAAQRCRRGCMSLRPLLFREYLLPVHLHPCDQEPREMDEEGIWVGQMKSTM